MLIFKEVFMKKKHSAATKRKISFAQSGKKNSMYGKKHKKLSLLKMSKNNKGKNNPMHGKHHTKETKKKISLAIKRARKAKKRK